MTTSVNTASRMESSGESNRIQVSGYSAKKLKKLGYKVTFRGQVSVKVSTQFYLFLMNIDGIPHQN